MARWHVCKWIYSNIIINLRTIIIPTIWHPASYWHDVKDVYVTCTRESISVVSSKTGTCEATLIVNAASTSATTSVVCCTLVDIYVVTNSPYVHSLVHGPWAVAGQHTRQSLLPNRAGLQQLYQLVQFHTSQVREVIFRWFTIQPSCTTVQSCTNVRLSSFIFVQNYTWLVNC